MAKFIPPGYTSVERAILKFSEAAAPHAWLSVPEAEKNVWDSTVLNDAGGDLLPRLLAYCRRSDVLMKDAPRMRYVYYRDALNDLRQRLHTGSVVAWCLDQNNQFGRIRSEGWRRRDADGWFDNATTILETGIFSTETKKRRVMLYEGDVSKIERELGEWADQLINVGIIGRDRKFAEQMLRETHKPGHLWPGLGELWLFIKSFPQCRDLTRDEVESLRAAIDPAAVRRKGRPRKIPN